MSPYSRCSHAAHVTAGKPLLGLLDLLLLI